LPATLAEVLLAPQTKPQVVTDCYKLIDQQISEMSGVSGAAVKLAFKAVNTFMPGHAYHMAEKLLPDFVGQLEPYWADFNTAGGGQFGDYLAKHGDEVAGALLSVTDAKAASSDRPTVTKAYRTVRGGAAKHIQAALPRVGDLVQEFAA
jgi:hypothetical protein